MVAFPQYLKELYDRHISPLGLTGTGNPHYHCDIGIFSLSSTVALSYTNGAVRGNLKIQVAATATSRCRL